MLCVRLRRVFEPGRLRAQASALGTSSRIELIDPRSNGIARHRLPLSLDAWLVNDADDLLGRRTSLGQEFLLDDLGDTYSSTEIHGALVSPA